MISIGEALVDALPLGIDGHPRVRRAVDWIADVAQPARLADDGAEYTGVIFPRFGGRDDYAATAAT